LIIIFVPFFPLELCYVFFHLSVVILFKIAVKLGHVGSLIFLFVRY